METAQSRFPFSTSFQFRDEERSGLEALFMRTFFDVPFTPEAQQALLRTRWQGPAGGAAGASGPIVVPELSPAARTAPAGAASPAAPESTLTEAQRYILLYRGADGIGKTRVFRQFRESARSRHISVYEVNHHDVEGIPFKPFLHAIREILRDHDQGAALQEKYRYGLESLLPELYQKGGPGAPGESPTPPERLQEGFSTLLELDDAGRVRIFDAITQLLLEVTARKPLVILVHDLHWSDRPTIELLDYIGRSLQLRTAPPAGGLPLPASQGQGASWQLRDFGSGAELDDLDSEEWRAALPPSASAQELLGVPYYAFPPQSQQAGRETPDANASPAEAAGRAGSERDPGDGTQPASAAARLSQKPPRLMILANYRGFVNQSHYLELALRSLADKPFVYHGELRPLSASEAELFVKKCVEGVEVGGRRLEISPQAAQAIQQASEGFPSFMHELLRALYLREGAFAGLADPLSVWDAQTIADALLAFEAAPAPTSADSGIFVLPQGSTVRIDTPDERQPPGRRHAILRLRVASTSANELRVLQVLATARRPLTAALLRDVVAGAFGDRAPDAAGAVEQSLAALEDRGIIERHEDVPGTVQFFLRLWDYTLVLEEKIDPTDKKLIHRCIGEAYRARLAPGTDDEGAFEVYYHLRRGPEPKRSIEYGMSAARRFVRAFALEKARRVYNRMLEVLSAAEDLPAREEILEQTALITLALKEGPAAEEILRRLQTEAAAVMTPERKVDLILLEAEAARTSDPARGLKILSKTSKLLKDENSRQGVQLQLATARMRLERQDLKRAINFGLNGANICQKIGDVPELGEIYRIIASAFYRKGDYTHAVDNYERALDAFERLGLKEASVRALDELGRVYLERGHYFRAARYLYKALEIRRRRHDLPGLCSSYDELGRVYLRSGDYLKTIDILNRSLALKERIGDFAGLNPTSFILGDLYFRLGRYEKSLLYLKLVVDNSQRLGDTAGLVEALGQLGRAHFEIGDIKQAEVYAKQVSILATEFKLRSQEADGALLDGNLRAFNRDWNGAEKSFKLAAEVHGKLGHRRREICAYLDLAELKIDRELHDEALKQVSRGQLIAEEVKALDLQVRALTIKGNVHRFLKGGNPEKVRELLHKALELSQKISDVLPLFDLHYTLAKVCHSQREFAEAANYYSKAELILKQVGDGLSEERAARYFEDRRRKTFAEDVGRFRKEVLGRATTSPPSDLRESQAGTASLKDRPIGFADYKDLTERVLRVNADLNQLHFQERILTEAVELSGADRGFILRVQNRQYFPVAFHGFGKSPAQHPEFLAASAIAQEVIRRGRSVLVSGPTEGAQEKGLELTALSHCSILAVPFMTNERIFGGIYLDKPIVVGQFLPRNQAMLETFAQHSAVALANRRELETAIREQLTGFYTPGYFLERLREAYRWFNLHGKSFTLLGYLLPQLEEVLGEGKGEVAQALAKDLADLLPPRAAICWASPILNVLLAEADVSAQDEVAARVRERLEKAFGQDVAHVVVPAHNRYHQGSEIYFEVRKKLLPEPQDRKAVSELGALLAPQVTLREAKLILERHKIESTLRKTGGNITHAARELGVHRPQLSNLLKKHALKRAGGDLELNGEETEGAVGEPTDN